MIKMSKLLPIPQLLNRDLGTNEIHIWCASLNQPVLRFQWLLSIDERMRAERFHFETDRKRFIVRRGILRMILGHYLDIEPSRLQFCYGENGKPALADIFGKGTVQFNLSHSEGVALYAFTRDREIGVDIELIRDISEMEQIAERFFSTREKAVFHTLTNSRRKKAFYNCWTRKEAFIKATGEGLSLSLDGFDVSLAPGEPASLLRIEGDRKAASRWSIQEVETAIGFAGAVAMEGQIGRISNQQWSG
jgi:4'-phosphopantetheinyl transferase